MIEGSNDGYTPMSWSPNKYNRLYANACPVGEELKDSFKNIQIYTLKYSHDLNQITDEKERMKSEMLKNISNTRLYRVERYNKIW